MTPTILCLALVALCAWQTYISHRERQSLLDRIQARDLSEYKALTEPPPPKEKKEEGEPVQWV